MCAKSGQWQWAMELTKKMQHAGFSIPSYTFASLITSFSNSKQPLDPTRSQ